MSRKTIARDQQNMISSLNDLKLPIHFKEVREKSEELMRLFQEKEIQDPVPTLLRISLEMRGENLQLKASAKTMSLIKFQGLVLIILKLTFSKDLHFQFTGLIINLLDCLQLIKTFQLQELTMLAIN